MWSLTLPRAERTSGPEKFSSVSQKDFFNTIGPVAACRRTLNKSATGGEDRKHPGQSPAHLTRAPRWDGSMRQKPVGSDQSHHGRENQQSRHGFSGGWPGGSPRGLRLTRPLRPRAVIDRCTGGFWFRRRARASHLAIIGGVDLANCRHFRLGLAHPFEPGSIVSQEPLRVWRQVIEATELGHHKPCGKIRLSFGAGFSGDTDARA